MFIKGDNFYNIRRLFRVYIDYKTDSDFYGNDKTEINRHSLNVEWSHPVGTD